MPIENRIQREPVNCRCIDPPLPFRSVLLSCVDRHEAVLLPHKMENSEVSQYPPKNHRSNRIQQNAADPNCNGRVREQVAMTVKLRRIQIGAPKRAVNMGDIDTDDQQQPSLRRHRLRIFEPTRKQQNDQRRQKRRRNNEQQVYPGFVDPGLPLLQ